MNMDLSGFDVHPLLYLSRDVFPDWHEPHVPFGDNHAPLTIGGAEAADDIRVPIAATCNPGGYTQTEFLGEDSSTGVIAVPVGIAGERMDILVHPDSLSYRVPLAQTRPRGGD